MTVITQGLESTFLVTQGYGLYAPFVVYVDARAAQISAASSDSDPFGVDPRAAQLYAGASSSDPHAIDARAARLITSSSDSDPFGVDARAAKLVS